MTYVNPTDQFRYEIETESHDLGITYVYTDDVDNAVQYCCDVSRDYQTRYSLVRDKFTERDIKSQVIIGHFIKAHCHLNPLFTLL